MTTVFSEGPVFAIVTTPVMSFALFEIEPVRALIICVPFTEAVPTISYVPFSENEIDVTESVKRFV